MLELWFHSVVVHRIQLRPAYLWRHGGEDRVHVAASFESEGGAAVVEEVELDVAAAAQLLPAPLRGAVGLILAARNDGQVGVQEAQAAVAA